MEIIYPICLVLSLLLAGSGASKETEENCPDVCEPEKCPNVGPIGLSQCPAEEYIVTYRCGCCKRCDVRPVTTTFSPLKRAEVCEKVNCPKKKVCVLNMQGLPVCKCPTEELCKRYINRGAGKKLKVCGSDGVTYPSRCHLKVASCASDGKIRVASKGDCNAPTTTVPTLHKTTRTNKKKGNSKRQQSNRGNNKKQGRRADKKPNRKQNKRRERNYQRALRVRRVKHLMRN